MIQLLAWEERNYIEQKKNSDNKRVLEIKDTMIKTKASLMQNDWRDITDPKLRKKMRKRISAKLYREKNKDAVRLSKKNYQAKTKQKRCEYSREYRKRNKEKIKEYQKEYTKEYQIKNKERLNVYKRNYYKKRLKKTSDKDIQFVISNALRNRFRQALKKNHKTGHAVRDLGCSIIEFKSYLESKFQEGMSWNNYGLHGWHIDHVKPLALFDLSDKKQVLEACHYTNLQPLWAKDNFSKSDKY